MICFHWPWLPFPEIVSSVNCGTTKIFSHLWSLNLNCAFWIILLYFDISALSKRKQNCNNPVVGRYHTWEFHASMFSKIMDTIWRKTQNQHVTNCRIADSGRSPLFPLLSFPFPVFPSDSFLCILFACWVLPVSRLVHRIAGYQQLP